MDPSQPHTAPPLNEEEDEWDTEGFVIPSLGMGDPGQSKSDASELERKPPSPKAKKEENIYLGPHGAPPSQPKPLDLNSAGRNQRFKQKLKEAHKRVESSGGRVSAGMAKGSSPRYWLDPHCHEYQFERWHHH